MAYTLRGKPTDALAALVTSELEGINVTFENVAGDLSLETREGTVLGNTAVVRFLARVSAVAGLEGKGPLEVAQVRRL